MGGSCLLGSINLAAYVDKKTRKFKFKELRDDIHIIVKGMNDVLDQGLPLHPLSIQRETVRDWRQIGIGIMGLADMLIHLNLQYDTDEAQRFCDDLGFILANEAIKANALLAKQEGTYPKYNREAVLNSVFLWENTDEETYELVEKYGLRNSQILTIAPTGTLSTMLGISGGIEPIFSLSYTRKTEYNGVDQYHKVFTKIADEYMKEHGLTEEEELPNFFVTAQNIDPFKRVEMQGVWQRHIDASISSTVNLPNSATVEEVEALYIHAWKNGLKGMTIFRDGCERVAVLTTGNKKEEQEITEEESKELKRGEWKSLAEDTYYVKRKLVIGCGTLKLFIGYSPREKAIQDLYIVKSGQGGCEKNLQAIAIAMSALLRVGGSLEQLEKAFSGIGACPSFASARAKGIELSKGNYCGMTIINEVKKFLKEVNGEQPNVINKKKEIKNNDLIGLEVCPECKEKTLMMTGGCMQCSNCSYTKCE